MQSTPKLTRALVDMMNPIPTTKPSHKYLLTVMVVATLYPESTSLRSSHAKVVLKALLTFITLPPEVQSDQGTSFTSKLFAETMIEWGIKYILSSAYHPQS